MKGGNWATSLSNLRQWDLVVNADAAIPDIVVMRFGDTFISSVGVGHLLATPLMLELV